MDWVCSNKDNLRKLKIWISLEVVKIYQLILGPPSDINEDGLLWLSFYIFIDCNNIYWYMVI